MAETKKKLYPNAVFYPTFYKTKEGKHAPQVLVTCSVAVGKDSEGRKANGDKKAFISFNAALNCNAEEGYKAARGGHSAYGKSSDTPTWLKCQAFGATAEAVMRLHKDYPGVKKGDLLAIEGFLKLEPWENAEKGTSGEQWVVTLQKGPLNIGAKSGSGNSQNSSAKAASKTNEAAPDTDDDFIDIEDDLPDGVDSEFEIDDEEDMPF